jgi:hypothetical protein
MIKFLLPQATDTDTAASKKDCDHNLRVMSQKVTVLAIKPNQGGLPIAA